MDLELSRGVHSVSLVVSLNAKPGKLRLKLEDLPGSPAQVQIVGGK